MTCKYCTEAWQPLFRVVDTGVNLTVAVVGRLLVIDDKKTQDKHYLRISYCPVCGRELSKEVPT